MVTNDRDLGVQFPQDRGVQVMRDEQRSPIFCGGGGGGGVRGDINLDNNSDSFDKHVSPLIAFSH